MSQQAPHESVLLGETLELLAPRPGELAVDGTLGAGGHAEALLEAVAPEGRVFGIDRDQRALAIASERLSRFGERFVPLHGDHCDLRRLLESRNVPSVDRMIFDLGVSSMQLDDPARGFSFLHDGPLDMRMDPSSGESAADLVARLDESEIREILWRFGEEKQSRRIARAIVGRRELEPIRTTRQLAALVETTLGPAARRYKLHPATRTFQALRIAINGELDGLEALVVDAVDSLNPGGRLAVIAFHSLEDRVIKRTLRRLAHRCECPPRLPVCGCGKQDLVRLVTSRPVRPSSEEARRNPRSRSARLRVAERLQ